MKISENDLKNNTESDKFIDKDSFYSEKNIDFNYKKDLIEENE